MTVIINSPQSSLPSAAAAASPSCPKQSWSLVCLCCAALPHPLDQSLTPLQPQHAPGLQDGAAQVAVPTPLAHIAHLANHITPTSAPARWRAVSSPLPEARAHPLA